MGAIIRPEGRSPKRFVAAQHCVAQPLLIYDFTAAAIGG